VDPRHELGRCGEDAAARLYARHGFRLLARNFRCSAGEIDIVARRGSLLVFCEVKTRASDLWGAPMEAVDHRKRARLRRLAAAWLSRHPTPSAELRFDVVSVLIGPSGERLTHVPDAF
jgi:putative endonuclease